MCPQRKEKSEREKNKPRAKKARRTAQVHESRLFFSALSLPASLSAAFLSPLHSIAASALVSEQSLHRERECNRRSSRERRREKQLLSSASASLAASAMVLTTRSVAPIQVNPKAYQQQPERVLVRNSERNTGEKGGRGKEARSKRARACRCSNSISPVAQLLLFFSSLTHRSMFLVRRSSVC